MGTEGQQGHSSPGQGLSWVFLCFRCALGQDTVVGIWEGFGEPHGALQQWGMICQGATSSVAEASCDPHAILNGVRSWCLSRGLSCCAACLQHGQQNWLVWHLVRSGHQTVAPVGKDSLWGCFLGNEWMLGHYLPAPRLKPGVWCSPLIWFALYQKCCSCWA